eukprot:CAMPEP_0204053640 /NCGR_PEP_ID=MMETSP0360-20130528/127056_1 /ASSEMBLY_ACC=CAM_ASM_000342 /TAXON_ID=268821 /ORGANISM="Scrippsiella Hangoei, Strain SHTV-5" /LENGTH=79 /DNA_ID=CAMNT_0051000853 /DNA_START=133 /DNA_END=370 /DNA_ORIENTATION=-
MACEETTVAAAAAGAVACPPEADIRGPGTRRCMMGLVINQIEEVVRPPQPALSVAPAVAAERTDVPHPPQHRPIVAGSW